MVDFFLLLIQPGSGDELQGIKKGIVEMADAIAVTKADGDNIKTARATRADFQHALHMQQAQRPGWTPKVVACSSVDGTGLSELRDLAEDFRHQLSASGYFATNRKDQNTAWFRDHFHLLLSLDPKQFPYVLEKEQALKELVRTNTISPRKAASQLLEAYHQAIKQS